MRRRRSRGRPPVDAEHDVRSALLEAASRLFLRHGFERVTARQIATAAGTTPAMIHYYYGNKLGLFRAMIERAIAPVREVLARAAHVDAPLPELAALVVAHMRMVAGNPWIPTLIVNEVFAEKGRFRATFTREIAARQLPLLIALLERGRTAGRLRPELDLRFTAMSILSLCLFPFIARPVLGPMLGLSFEDAELERVITHTAQVLMRGTQAPLDGQQLTE